MAPMLATWGLVLAACLLDRWIGDPPTWPHPVQALGALIESGRRLGEGWAADRPRRLRLAGAGLALLTVAVAALAGWGIEQLARRWPPLGLPLLVVCLASALAGGSLERAVRAVLERLDDPEAARSRLAWIVGRDVDGLDQAGILRAVAETASENAVDGLFAPLFWMLTGAALWGMAPAAPGPLCLAWIFKSASTLDSMLGYRRGRLRWFGTAGARLDDALIDRAPKSVLSDALAVVGLSRQRDIEARRLSQGQRQRLHLARLALALRTQTRPLWLMDEPSAALDDAGTALLLQLLDTHLSRGGAAIVATHLPISTTRGPRTVLNLQDFAPKRHARSVQAEMAESAYADGS